MARNRLPVRFSRWRRRHGQAALEFLLLLAFFILPMSFLAWALLKYQREMFDIFSWFLSLPVP
jgi:hypothetical protein